MMTCGTDILSRWSDRQTDQQTDTSPLLYTGCVVGGARGSGTGTGNSNGGGGRASADPCAAKDPCGGPASNTMSATMDQALIGAVTKKLSKDIDMLADKLKEEARMLVAQFHQQGDF